MELEDISSDGKLGVCTGLLLKNDNTHCLENELGFHVQPVTILLIVVSHSIFDMVTLTIFTLFFLLYDIC